jgi:hypothetical protein
MGATRRAFFVLTCVAALTLFASTRASAQEEAQLTGVVKDASGAVLPGVTVEASSPVLIEKVRTTVSDGTGQYRIANLRPGTYAMTFTLAGFQTLKRDALEVSGRGVFTVNADMKVGTVAETITVTGETPVVDTQSVRRQTSISGETVNAIPTARSYGSLLALIPGVTGGPTGDVQVTPGLMLFNGAGGRGAEGRMLVDGLGTGAINGGGAGGYIADILGTAEVVTTNSGNLGEQEVGGPTISFVPKSGGNTFKGSAYGAGFNDRMVSNNITTDLQNRGFTGTPATIAKQWDVSAGVGGPIKKDRLWFYSTYRDEGAWTTIPGNYANKNFANITAPHTPNSAVSYLYAPDTTLPAYIGNSYQIANLRLTTQLTPRNKLNLFWDEQRPCNGSSLLKSTSACRNPTDDKAFLYVFVGASTTSPEAGGYAHRFQRVQQASWNSPVSNRVLLEAAVGTYLTRWNANRRPDSVSEDIIPVTELCSAGCANNGGRANYTYRSESPVDNWIGQHNWRASASYVTGAHSFKVGYQGFFMTDDRQNAVNSTFTSYSLQNGSAVAASPASSITERADTYVLHQRVRSDGFYLQDQWTHGRWTLQGAVRYDYARSYFADQTVGGVRFLPTATTFSQDDPLLNTPSTLLCSSDLKGTNLPAGFNGTCSNNVWGYKDITPRGGVAWDVFGTGATAVKISMGKYLEAVSSGYGNYTSGNPVSRMLTNTSRTWVDGNGNYTPDCDLTNPAAQNSLSQGGDSCAALNPNFGKAVFNNSFDYTNMGGWGVRPTDWAFVASVQQQLQARTSVEIAYTRRWLNNWTVVDNLLTTPSDYGAYSVLAPTSTLLPASVSGQVIPGFYNVNPTLQNGLTNTAANNFATAAGNFGEAYARYNGVTVNLTSRMRNGLNLQAGFNTGKTVGDDCAIAAKIPELTLASPSAGLPGTGGGGIPAVSPAGGAVVALPANRWCHSDTGFVTRVTGLTAYTIPKVDVLVSGTVRSDQGNSLSANYTVPQATTNPALTGQIVGLGRPLSNLATGTTVNLLAPGTLWGDRINEVDFKFAKVLRFGRTRTNVGIEVFNALNSSAVLTYTQTLSINSTTGASTYLTPLTILTPRFFKFSAQIEF